MSISKETAEHMNAQARRLRDDPDALDKEFIADMQRRIAGVVPSFFPLNASPAPSSPDVSPIVAAAGFSSEDESHD